ncbi:MAG TPA: hypothetical protein VFQ91_00355 [Bryobacteraceae bacterium]|nr:hypothetical protein [Bryobacteraceae bacterium]
MNRRALFLLLPAALTAKEKKLSDDERMALLRGLTAEYAKAKILIPRSKKPLPIHPNGAWSRETWDKAGVEQGPAARVGEMVQITKVRIEDNRVELELNHGLKTGPKWYERVEVGMGTNTTPISGRDNVAKAGTNLAIVFGKNIETLDVAEVKKMLGQVLDFDMRSVTETYMEKLPEPVRKAIEQKRVIEGMDREQVRLALGQPVRKERRVEDGDELEDWMYGRPPGKMTFITFTGSKVTKVKDMYAGLGGSVAAELPVQ